MFNSLKSKLGQVPTEDMAAPQLEDMYPTSFDEDLTETDPQSVLADPMSTVEAKQIAIQKIKDKYLKPKDNGNE